MSKRNAVAGIALAVGLVLAGCFLGKGDNTFYIAEQVEAANVDPYHHRIVIRAEALVPEFDLQTSGG